MIILINQAEFDIRMEEVTEILLLFFVKLFMC